MTRRLEAHIAQRITQGRENNLATPEQISGVINTSGGPSKTQYRTFGNGLTCDWFTDTKVLKQHTPDLVDITKFYFEGIDTWYGPKPFEVWLNTRYMREAFYGLGRFDTCLDILDDESEYITFLKPLIIDTGNFIATGKRQVPLKLLMSYHADYVSRKKAASAQNKEYGGEEDAPTVKRQFATNHFDGMSTALFFKTWLKQPDGVNDFVMAHRMLFGV